MDILLKHSKEELISAREVLNNPRYREYIEVLLKDRVDYWKDRIASEDKDDIERRGIIKGLNWVLGLTNLLSRAISSTTTNI